MVKTISDTLSQIKEALKEKPLSISEISKKLEINWRTAQAYLNALEELGFVFKRNVKNSKTYYFVEKDNLFHLPVTASEYKKISSIYSQINKIYNKVFKKDPTDTQAQKILWKINQKLKLHLPIGWYLYGPCCVQKYTGEEKDYKVISNKQLLVVKEVVQKYGHYNSYEIKNKIYQEESNELYEAKEKLLSLSYDCENKLDLNIILMDLLKHSPNEAKDLVTDFVRTTLLIDWDKNTRELFDNVWRFLSRLVFRNSIKDRYPYIDVYMGFWTKVLLENTQIKISELVKAHISAKHSQDKLYQRFLGK